MRRPQKSTKERWLDEFADWNIDDQEYLLDMCQFIHRQAKRKAPKPGEPQPAATLLDDQPESEAAGR